MDYSIGGIQQLGVGVRDVETAWSWFRRAFGMDVPVFQDEAEAPLMTRYTGGQVQRRNAVLAINMSGGSGFEIWQFKSREPVAPSFEPSIGDTGILAGVMKSADVAAAHRFLVEMGANVVSAPTPGPDGVTRFFVRDPHGNVFQVVPAADWFGKPAVIGGVAGAIIGTTDIDRARPLYQELLGYDTLLSDSTGVFDDLAGLPEGGRKVRRVLLGHSVARRGPFAPLMGSSTIELIQPMKGPSRKVFADRYWGDLGFIHLCFDVRGMDAIAAKAAEIGHAFTIDSAETFDMGSAGGRFSYVEDPDGTLIEFVETHKVPVYKPLGLGINLIRRPPEKSLPRWMIRMLGLARVK